MRCRSLGSRSHMETKTRKETTPQKSKPIFIDALFFVARVTSPVSPTFRKHKNRKKNDTPPKVPPSRIPRRLPREKRLTDFRLKPQQSRHHISKTSLVQEKKSKAPNEDSRFPPSPPRNKQKSSLIQIPTVFYNQCDRFAQELTSESWSQVLHARWGKRNNTKNTTLSSISRSTGWNRV